MCRRRSGRPEGGRNSRPVEAAAKSMRFISHGENCMRASAARSWKPCARSPTANAPSAKGSRRSGKNLFLSLLDFRSRSWKIYLSIPGHAVGEGAPALRGRRKRGSAPVAVAACGLDRAPPCAVLRSNEEKSLRRNQARELAREGEKTEPYREEDAPWFTPILNRGEPEGFRGKSRPFRFGRGARASRSGSNNWVVSPKSGKSTHAWLANDPHLSLQEPSFWHAVRLASASGRRSGSRSRAFPCSRPG